MAKSDESPKGPRVGRRITIALAIGNAVLLPIAVMSVVALANVAPDFDHHAITLDGPMSAHASRARTHASDLRRFEKDMFLNVKDPAKVEAYFKKWDAVRQAILKEFDELDGNAHTTEAMRAVKNMREQFAAYEAGLLKVVERIRKKEINDPETANAAIAPYKEAVHAVEGIAEMTISDRARILREDH
jgi:methyl-accepting chemotaxis protein